jgi:hypothetical protein
MGFSISGTVVNTTDAAAVAEVISAVCSPGVFQEYDYTAGAGIKGASCEVKILTTGIFIITDEPLPGEDKLLAALSAKFNAAMSFVYIETVMGFVLKHYANGQLQKELAERERQKQPDLCINIDPEKDFGDELIPALFKAITSIGLYESEDFEGETYILKY